MLKQCNWEKYRRCLHRILESLSAELRIDFDSEKQVQHCFLIFYKKPCLRNGKSESRDTILFTDALYVKD